MIKLHPLHLGLILFSTVILLSLSACSPQETRIAYMRYDRQTQHQCYYSIDTAGQNLVNLAEYDYHLPVEPSQSWSTSRGILAYIDDISDAPRAWLSVIDAYGKNKRNIIEVTGLLADSICMSPDGKTILATFSPRQRISDDIDFKGISLEGINKIDVTTGIVKLLTGSSEFGLNSPVYSPNGERIALLGRTVEDTSTALYIMDADGTNLQRVTDLEGLFPYTEKPLYWSPDSSKILFVGGMDYDISIDGYYYDIFVIDINSGGMTNLTNSPQESEIRPTWSPDAKQIAFLSYNFKKHLNQDTGVYVSDPPCIYVMDADSKKLKKIYDSGSYPCWLPDGKTILFSYGSKIQTIKYDGTDLQTIFDCVDGQISYPVWISK